MSSKSAVTVENLNKFYRIGVAVNKSDTFAAALAKFIRSPVTNYKKYRSLYKFNDIDLTLCSHGIGGPGAAICFEELIKIGA